MANRKIEFGTASQGITISLAPSGVGLASGSARESTVVDNTSDKFPDATIYLKIQLASSGTLGSDKAIYVYAHGSEDGSNYEELATGADAAITLGTPTNFRLLDVISVARYVTSTAEVFKRVIPSVARAFGGILLPKWGIIIVNKTGITFNATESNHTKEYRGLYETIA